MLSYADKNYFKVYIKFAVDIITHIGSGIFSSYKLYNNIEDRILVYFCLFITPIFVAQSVINIAILSAVVAVLGIVGILIGLYYTLIGTWPAFIMTIGITVITIVRIPYNIYYTFKILYYSACMTRTLKFVLAILNLPTLFLTPVVVVLVAPVVTFVTCFVTSFCGWFLKPWAHIEIVLKKFWKIYATDAKEFANDYGHPSGIPNNWDGTMYGGLWNPLLVTVAVITFLHGLITMSIGTVLIITIKFIPMYAFVVIRFAREGTEKAMKWYVEGFKSWAKTCKIENYCDLMEGYTKISPLKLVSDDCCENIILSWLILISFVAWIAMWPIVIVGPILSFMFGVVTVFLVVTFTYIFMWIFHLTFPIPASIAFICMGPFFSVRCPTVALKHNIMLPGQLARSLKHGFLEPFYFFKYLDRQTSKFSVGKFSLFLQENIPEFEGFISSWEIPESIWKKSADKIRKINYWDLGFGKLQHCRNELIEKKWISQDDIESLGPNVLVSIPSLAILDVLIASITKDINNKDLIYWDEDHQCDDTTRDRKDNIISHYFPRLIDIKNDLILLHDQNVSEASTQFRTTGLVDPLNPLSVRNLSAEHIASTNTDTTCCWPFCSGSAKSIVIPQSNILEKEIWYMKAKICSGDEDQSPELQNALNKYTFNDRKVIVINRICAKTKDLVYSLLRVREMNKRINLICVME
jgi:hypothetical protein